MPLYFFHLSFGDRLVRDEEGVELPSRAAALREAFGVARDLSDPANGGDPRRWAGWFLQVADAHDTIVRAPIGYPALEVAGKDAARRGSGRPELLPGRPGREELARPKVPLREIRPCSKLAALAKRILLQRKRTAELLEWNQRLRGELSSELLAAERARTEARRLVAGERGIEIATVSGVVCGAATRPAGHGRPNLVLLQGGR